MLSRNTLLPIAVATAVGLPYLTSSSGLWTTSDEAKPDVAQAAWEQPLASLDSKSAAGGAVPSEGARPGVATPSEPVVDLGEVIRFDMNTAWVVSRWPRVSTRLADLDLQGYRVPLVTGTAEDDLAGALTYYFDEQQRLQRLTFYGTTGDARRLVALLATQYQFMRKYTDDPGLYLYQVMWNGKPHSELQVRPAKVVRADAPHARFEVALVMQRPPKMK